MKCNRSEQHAPVDAVRSLGDVIDGFRRERSAFGVDARGTHASQVRYRTVFSACLRVCLSVSREDGWSWKSFVQVGGAVADILLSGQVNVGPVFGTHFDDPFRAHALRDEIGFKADLNAATADGGCSLKSLYVEEFPSSSHLGGAGGTAFGVLERVFRAVHERVDARLQRGVERGIHAAEKSCSDGGSSKLLVLDGIDPSGHPARADERFVDLGLTLGGAFQCCVVHPDIRHVKTGEHATGSGLPRDTEVHGLASESLFSVGGPDAFLDEAFDEDAFAAAPDAGSGVNGQRFFEGISTGIVFGVAAGGDGSCLIQDFDFFESPGEPVALAVAGFVFHQ